MKAKRLLAVSMLSMGCAFGANFAHADKGNLSTQSGHELGLSVASYRYSEPAPMVTIKATKIGIDYTGTWAFGDQLFARAELRYVDGKAKYNGSGTLDNVTDWYYEVRGLIGRDYALGNSVISPFAGFGYRYLYNDLRGTTSTGNIGYRRENGTFTLPIGINHKININGAQLFTTVEFDYLLNGEQKSRLSDLVGHGFSAATDVTNRQDSGYGWRLSSMYRLDNLSVGPYLYYWHVNDSNQVTTSSIQNGTLQTSKIIEPNNNTREIGVRAAYRF